MYAYYTSVRRVNSRAPKGDFFTQKGLNLMASQIDTEILFIVSFIKSLFMRHVRAGRPMYAHAHTPAHTHAHIGHPSAFSPVRELRHGQKGRTVCA